ncbi:hypothetical protein VNO80_10349 [Phaseolus coccineus]|uniref:Uncharacterized protein n=1 Tax=Phaseolus coccineus TaxID=3886 RepID=A0AAN9N7Y9_PHACN
MIRQEQPSWSPMKLNHLPMDPLTHKIVRLFLPCNLSFLHLLSLNFQLWTWFKYVPALQRVVMSKDEQMTSFVVEKMRQNMCQLLYNFAPPPHSLPFISLQYEHNSTIAVIEGEGDDALQVFAPIDLD